MMEAYFDESGTHDGSPVVCVAGYLLSTEQARHLNREWASTLAEFGVTHFHATDCGNRRGEFKRLTQAQSIELTKRIIGIIKRRIEVGFAVTISDTDFNQITPPTWEKGGPYMLGVMYALAGVSAWADANNYQGEISYFFEKGDKHELAAYAAIQELAHQPVGKHGLRHNSHAFIPKLGNGPIQAADVLAYEWFREISRINDPANTRPSRLSFDNLLAYPGYYTAHISASDLVKFFARDKQFMIEKMGSFQKPPFATVNLI